MMWAEPDLAGVAVRLPGNVAAFSTDRLAFFCSYIYEHISNEDSTPTDVLANALADSGVSLARSSSHC